MTQKDYYTIYHEMGHTYNQLFYWDQPYMFRETANPAFHEAVGDALSRSAMGPVHLQKIGLLEKKKGAMENKGKAHCFLYKSY